MTNEALTRHPFEVPASLASSLTRDADVVQDLDCERIVDQSEYPPVRAKDDAGSIHGRQEGSKSNDAAMRGTPMTENQVQAPA